MANLIDFTSSTDSLLDQTADVETPPSVAPRTAKLYGVTFLVTIGAFASGAVFIITDQTNLHIVLGATLMSPVAGLLMSKIGRKLSLVAYVMPGLIGLIFLTWTSFIVPASLLIGSSVGAFTVIIPVYLSEISQAKIRGRLVSYFTIMFNLGMMYGYLTKDLLDRMFFGVACGVGFFVFLLVVKYIPESPRYNLRRGKINEAKETLLVLRGQDFDVDGEIQLITSSQQENSEDQGITCVLEQLLMDKFNRKAFITVIGLVAAFQFSGLYTVLTFNDAYLWGTTYSIPNGIILGLVFLFSTFLSSVIVDIIGRRILLLLSTANLFMCYILLALCDLVEINDDKWTLIRELSIEGILIVLVVMHSFGLGPITWTFMTEVLNDSVKDIGVGLAVMFSYGFSAIVTLLFYSMIHFIGWGYVIFSGFSLVGFVFIYFMVPETKGKTLEEIQQLLRA